MRRLSRHHADLRADDGFGGFLIGRASDGVVVVRNERNAHLLVVGVRAELELREVCEVDGGAVFDGFEGTAGVEMASHGWFDGTIDGWDQHEG